MIWKNSTFLFACFFLLISCGTKTKCPDFVHYSEGNEYASTSCLIEPGELQSALLSDSDFKLIDFRKPEEYKSGHMIGALNIWRSDIEDTSYAYGGMMPTKLQLEKLLGSLGISPADTIIIYDNKAQVDAARLWWVLKFYGHENMKLLNGGLKDWMVMEGELQASHSTITPCEYEFKNPIDSSIYASIELVRSVIEDSNLVLLDTRGLDEFSGGKLKNGAAWAGHIPSALNLDWAEAVDYNGNHKFLTVKELKIKYDSLGITGEQPVVTYCHSGVRSAHTLFVLTELLGYENIRNYDGSWTEWSHLNREENSTIPLP